MTASALEQPDQFVDAPTGTSATDTAAIQAAHDALPATGGTILLQPGTYVCNSGGLAFTKRVKLVGHGAGDLSLNALTKIACSSTTAELLTLSASASVIEDVAFVNTAGSNPSAGCAIKVTSAAGMRINRCLFSGFYDNMLIESGWYWNLTDSIFLDPVRYGLRITSSVAEGDNGDPVISGNTFTTYNKTRNPTSAIRWEGGGGLKIFGNKINGGSQQQGAVASCGKFLYGLDFNCATGIVTSVLPVVGNSIENCTQFPIALGRTGTGSFGKVAISGNEIGIGTTGIYIQAGITNVMIGSNTFTNLTTGIRCLSGSSRIVVGPNDFASSVTTPLQVDSGATIVNFQGYPFTTAARPAVDRVATGAMYFDTTVGKPVWSNGTAWVDAAGSTVS